MARAFSKGIAEIYFVGSGNYRIEYNIGFAGPDVAGNVDYAPVSITVDGTTTLAQKNALLATAIRAQAVNMGFTVPANGVILQAEQLG